jgi:hypothetical protein
MMVRITLKLWTNEMKKNGMPPVPPGEILNVEPKRHCRLELERALRKTEARWRATRRVCPPSQQRPL